PTNRTNDRNQKKPRMARIRADEKGLMACHLALCSLCTLWLQFFQTPKRLRHKEHKGHKELGPARGQFFDSLHSCDSWFNVFNCGNRPRRALRKTEEEKRWGAKVCGARPSFHFWPAFFCLF